MSRSVGPPVRSASKEIRSVTKQVKLMKEAPKQLFRAQMSFARRIKSSRQMGPSKLMLIKNNVSADSNEGSVDVGSLKAPGGDRPPSQRTYPKPKSV